MEAESPAGWGAQGMFFFSIWIFVVYLYMFPFPLFLAWKSPLHTAPLLLLSRPNSLSCLMKHLFDVNPNYLVSLDCTFMVGTTCFSFQCFSTPIFFPYVVLKVLYPTSDCTYNLCFTEPSDYCCPAPSIGHWPRPLRIQLKNISFGPGTLKFVTQPVLFVCPPTVSYHVACSISKF